MWLSVSFFHDLSQHKNRVTWPLAKTQILGKVSGQLDLNNVVPKGLQKPGTQ